MITLNMRALYSGLFSLFDLDATATDLLLKVIAGSDKADDYEEILKKDKFYTSIICRIASQNMKTQVVSSLGHGVVVVGHQRTRDFVLGHTINRVFFPHADNDFKSMEDDEKIVKHAIKAEEHARRCRNEYSGLAFAAGYMFDIFEKWIDVDDSGYKETLQPLLESTWRHSLRTATIAWALATHPRVFLSYRKIIFASSLLHDIGKLGLALFDPKEYSKCLERMKFDLDSNITDHGYEAVIEREHFDLSHLEIGSALIFQARFLRDLELEIDFHHDSILLRTRNPDAFLGAVIINMADRIAWLVERRPAFGGEELQEIISKTYSYVPLNAQDVMQMTNELRGKGLLSG